MITDNILKSRTIEKIQRQLGSTILKALSENDTVELMLNPDCTVWVEKLGQGVKELCKLSTCNSLDLI